MSRIDDLFHHSERSEKSLERYLVARVEELGGKALKYYNANATGYPDRLCMFPGGVTFWVELKSAGKKSRPLQELRQNQLLGLGQNVYVCDSVETVDYVIDKHAKEMQS